MSCLRVGHDELLARGMSLPGLARRASALAQLPPLGLLTIAATAPADWDIDLVSDDGRDDEADIVDRILHHRPDVVAFSCLTPAVDRAARISALVRRQRVSEKRIVTVVGGLHATAAPSHCEPHFDVVTSGDGEVTLPRLLSDIVAGQMQLRYSANGSYCLAKSPTPRWDLIGPDAPPRYTLQTMRGCPWACSFCAASRLLGLPRTKSNDQIERELAAITAMRQRPWIELADDNTFASDRDHGPMLDALRQCGARWFTESDWRIAERPDLLRQIAASGCRQILIGLESSVFRYRGMGAKTAAWQRMIDAVDVIQAAGIIVNACFIVGADGETPESIERLGDYLETASMGEVQLTLQTPFPGTSLYDSLKAAGRLLPGDFSRYTLFDVVYQPDQMTAEQLQNAFHDLVSRVFRDDVQRRRDKIQKSIRAIARTR
ncbi:B12 binding domain protein [Allorhodopirellula heiligendammensis]|uniref:B12 binding domain protein n=2 Tax=Allorhodopirellula heiligendammensis TaxID=2714739 RepID=A0A5C6C175_9BACT|nr:B12 binding domain protein [Allorhodopirellula heiligendammensis]